MYPLSQIAMCASKLTVKSQLSLSFLSPSNHVLQQTSISYWHFRSVLSIGGCFCSQKWTKQQKYIKKKILRSFFTNCFSKESVLWIMCWILAQRWRLSCLFFFFKLLKPEFAEQICPQAPMPLNICSFNLRRVRGEICVSKTNTHLV